MINQPRRGIGQKSIENLREEATLRGINLYEVLKDPQQISGSIIKKCSSFVSLIEDLRRQRDNLSLEDFLDYVLEQSGYKKMLQEENEEERFKKT